MSAWIVSVRVEVLPSGPVTSMVRVTEPSSFFFAETTRSDDLPFGPVTVSVLVAVLSKVLVLPLNPVRLPSVVTVPSAFFFEVLVTVAVFRPDW